MKAWRNIILLHLICTNANTKHRKDTITKKENTPQQKINTPQVNRDFDKVSKLSLA